MREANCGWVCWDELGEKEGDGATVLLLRLG